MCCNVKAILICNQPTGLSFQIQAAPSQPACTPAANDPADSVDTANPYANDQDGCACVDPTDTSTCYCLVGYASNGANGCTG